MVLYIMGLSYTRYGSYVQDMIYRMRGSTVYYNANCLDRNRREPRYNYMTWKQKKEVIRDTNEICLVLLEYYYSKVNTPNYDFSDEKVARGLDWTKRKVLDNRLKLTKAGYFYKVVIRNSRDSYQHVDLGHTRWKDK